MTLTLSGATMPQDEVIAECGPMRWGAFKPALTEAVVEHLRPLQVGGLQVKAHCLALRECRRGAAAYRLPVGSPRPQTKYGQLMSDTAYIDAVLSRGAEAAAATAGRTLADVRDAMGFVPPFRATPRA
jgi:tryptophanyl-tRNA synthetase